MYEPVLGWDAALAFIVIGAFAVLYSTLVSATAANARLATDFLRVTGFIAPAGPRERFRWVQGICVVIMLVGLTLFYFFPNPVLMVMIGGFAQAITLPPIAAAAIYMRYRRTDRRVTPGLIWDAFLWLSLLAFMAAAGYGVWSQLRKLL
jgi:manganese transport protein